MIKKIEIILFVVLLMFFEYLPAQTLYMLSSTSGTTKMQVAANTHLVVSTGVGYTNSEFQNNSSSVITVSSSGYIDLEGDFENNGTATIDNDGTITVKGDWTNDASNNVFTNVTVGSDGTVEFTNSGFDHEIGGTNWTDFENLTFNNVSGTGGKMTVNNNRINGTLTLTDGLLSLNSNTLIMNNPSAGSLITDLGYIVSETIDGTPNPCNSRFIWNIGENTDTYFIPFGNTGGYATVPLIVDVTVAGAGTSGYIEAATYPTADDNTPFPSFPLTLTSMTPDVSYVVDRAYLLAFNDFTGNPTATLTIGYDPPDLVGNSMPESSIQAQYSEDGSNWSALAGLWQTPGANFLPFCPACAGGAVNGITDVTKSLVWVLVDQTHPLPIELLDFKAICDENKVNLTWTTATETNNDYFTIEKSPEFQNWSPLADVDGAGNSSSVISYSYADENPNRNVTYYRLKQTDYNDQYSYSDPISAYCYTSDNNIEVMEMQITADNDLLVSFSSNKGGLHHFNLYDGNGKLITDENIITNPGKNVLTYNLSNLSSDIYMFTIYNSSKSITRKILLIQD